METYIFIRKLNLQQFHESDINFYIFSLVMLVLKLCLKRERTDSMKALVINNIKYKDVAIVYKWNKKCSNYLFRTSVTSYLLIVMSYLVYIYVYFIEACIYIYINWSLFSMYINIYIFLKIYPLKLNCIYYVDFLKPLIHLFKW